MKPLFALVILLTASASALGQQQPDAIYQSNSSSAGGIAISAFQKLPGSPVQGAPYSATMTNQSVQTLADGNRIVQTSSGTIARDSLGRTRQDVPLPPLGNLSAANAPHLVFVQDLVTQTSYTLDLTHKTAQKMPVLPPAPFGPGDAGPAVLGALGGPAAPAPALPGPALPGLGGPGGLGAPGGPVNTVTIRTGTAAPAAPLGFPPGAPPVFFLQKGPTSAEQVLSGNQPSPTTEALGSQTMEGVVASGTRTTITIPVGQIGNDRAIDIVTEVWISPELMTVVYSKRSDPRMGEQTFQLTNIVRGEPDASLFTVPGDFKIVDGPQPIIYRPVQ